MTVRKHTDIPTDNRLKYTFNRLMGEKMYLEGTSLAEQRKEMAGILGLSPSRISRIINRPKDSNSDITAEQARKLMDYFDVDDIDKIYA